MDRDLALRMGGCTIAIGVAFASVFEYARNNVPDGQKLGADQADRKRFGINNRRMIHPAIDQEEFADAQSLFKNASADAFSSRFRPAPPPGHPFQHTDVGGRVGVRAGTANFQKDSYRVRTTGVLAVTVAATIVAPSSGAQSLTGAGTASARLAEKRSSSEPDSASTFSKSASSWRQ